jgi:hypothetical protein
MLQSVISVANSIRVANKGIKPWTLIQL